MENPPYIDGHCHCHEMKHTVLRSYTDYILVAVSDDLASSYRTLEITSYHGNIVPCVGIHPWNVGEHSLKAVESIENIVGKYEVPCLGEIGLDKVFVPRTYEKQLAFFEKLLVIAHEYGLAVNLHTPGTWRQVYELLVKYDIGKAYFHWYTGPLNLLREIEASGYYIGINPAWVKQDKHRRVMEEAPLSIVITESDAPYQYKGINLVPELVAETVKKLAEIHGVPENAVRGRIVANASKLYGTRHVVVGNNI